MSSNFWDEEKEICVVQKNKKDFIKMSECKKNGKTHIQLKQYYKDFNDEDKLKPAKGSPITMSKENFEDLIKEYNNHGNN